MADQVSPSLASIAVAACIVGLVTGYFLGQGSSIGLFSPATGNPAKKSTKKSWPNSYDVDVQMGSDTSDEEFIESIRDKKKVEDTPDSDDDDDEDDRQVKDFSDKSNEEVKLVLAVRMDLEMGKGKIAAQCGHATLAVYQSLEHQPNGQALLKRWMSRGQAKVALKVKSEEELETLQALAVSLGLCARVIHDAGRTQIAAGSATVLGVLGPKSVVDQVTGHLKLL